jgi:opacity protein-like surface antigen
MKKSILFFAIIALLIAAPAMAVDWVTANQTTVAWDAVTKSADGTVTFGAGEITYSVYLANAITDPNKANPAKVRTIPETQTTLTLNSEGKYYVGVSAVRTVSGSLIGESAISWSDAVTPAFGIQFFVIPGPPSGLRPQ